MHDLDRESGCEDCLGLLRAGALIQTRCRQYIPRTLRGRLYAVLEWVASVAWETGCMIER